MRHHAPKARNLQSAKASAPEFEALTRLANANADSIAAVMAVVRLDCGHPAELMQEILAQRRELAIDIVRAMLARGAAVQRARQALAPRARAVSRDAATIWAGMGLAERSLHRELRCVLAVPHQGDRISELLGLHYLRLELQHRELASLTVGRSTPPTGIACRRECDA